MTEKNTTITSSSYITGIQRINSNSFILSDNVSLPSNSYISVPINSIICDGGEINNIIDEFGSNLNIQVITKTYSGEYSDVVESVTNTTGKALVLSYTSEDRDVREGRFFPGEIVFVFKSSMENTLKPGKDRFAKIFYNGEYYQVERITKQPVLDVVYYLEARVRKI